MLIRLTLSLVVLGAGVLLLPRVVTELYARSRLFDSRDVPELPVAVVFGAGLWRDGSPSPVLRDRIATAVDLYFTGKVQKLLMSGDNRFVDYNEPGAMQAFALELGVPEEDIVLDFAGRRTYDTCYRARDIFGLESAILVTQRFHLPRALYTCNALGISAVGVPADRRSYLRRTSLFWTGRETVATLVALWELYVTHPLPVLGEPEPILARLEGP
jgi:SanA protein